MPGKSSRKDGKPHQAAETNHVSNMKCIHCNLGAQAPLDDELSCEEVKMLITEMFDIGVYNLEITGGEPLMRKDWKEILIHTHQYPAWKLTLNTNTNEERWFKLRYYRSPTDMSADADEPEIPKIFHHGIVLWGIEYVLRRNEEQSKKYALKQDFDSFMRSRINAYMVADDLDSPGVVMRNDYRTGVM